LLEKTETHIQGKNQIAQLK